MKVRRTTVVLVWTHKKRQCVTHNKYYFDIARDEVAPTSTICTHSRFNR